MNPRGKLSLGVIINVLLDVCDIIERLRCLTLVKIGCVDRFDMYRRMRA